MIWHTDVKANISNNKNDSLLKLSLPPLTPIKNEKEEKQAVQEEGKTFKELLRAYWQMYCEKSTIHGVRYIYDPTLRGIERLIWTALVITCVTLTCIAYYILTERYSAKKLQTVVENSQFPAFRIPFPAVGICTQNRINWERFEQAKEKFLPPAADKPELMVFTEFVKRMETLRFGHFDAFKDMEDINLELIDGIDVTKLAEFMAIRCEDIFINGTCFWRNMQFDCCSRFILEHTEYGYCLVFNSELSPQTMILQESLGEKYYPFHNARAGQNTGLNFRVKLASNLKRPLSKAENAITVYIKRPDQFSNTGYTITPNTATYFIVRPEITDSDEDLHILEPTRRNCYFEDETYLLQGQSEVANKSMLNNCLNHCHEDYLLKYCNCTLPLFFLFTDEGAEHCRPSKFRCLAKNNDIFSYDKHKEEDAYFSSAKPGMTCACLIPCKSIEYFTSITTLPICTDMYNDTSLDVYEIDVHYQSEVLIQYRTSLEFTIIDLIANFGGIFGLCLGASLVSAVELLYYATFGFGLYLFDNNYLMVFKANLKYLKEKWAVGLQNSLREGHEFENVVKTSAQRKNHSLHKDNYW